MPRRFGSENGSYPTPIPIEDLSGKHRLRRDTPPVWRAVKRTGVLVGLLVGLGTMGGGAVGGLLYVAGKADATEVARLKETQAVVLERIAQQGQRLERLMDWLGMPQKEQ